MRKILKRAAALSLMVLMLVGMVSMNSMAMSDSDSKTLLETLDLFKGFKPFTIPTTNETENGDGITRAEWLSRLTTIFEMTVEDEHYPDNYFSDLDSSSEYYYDILLAVQFGLIDVEVGGEVCPNELVTREFAAHTLNFCLGFQMSEGAEYTFSDVADCAYPVDAHVAIEQQWLSLKEGKFSPADIVPLAEAESMLAKAETILQGDVIDENHENSYVVGENVIEVPKGTNVLKKDDTTIVITNCPVEISAGDTFVVYFEELATSYVAKTVSKEGMLTTIVVEENAAEDSFSDINAEGIMDADFTMIEALDGAEVEYVDESTGETYSNPHVAQMAIKSLNKTLKVTKKIEIADGMSAKVTVKMKNPKIEYKINTSAKEVYAKFMGDSEIQYEVELEGEALSDKLAALKDIALIDCTFPGIGGFTIKLDITADGSAKGTTSGYLTAGLKYTASDGFRIVKDFNAKTFSISIEANVGVGVKAQLGIYDIPGDVLEAYVYAKVGGKGTLESEMFADSKSPRECTHFAAYIYAEYGATGSVKIGIYKESISLEQVLYNSKNSPVRIVRHYEDGKLVSKCNRDIDWSNGYYTKWNSAYGSCGWGSGSGSYGFDESGNVIELYTYTLDENNNATITGYSGNATSLIIPDTIDGYTVVGIGAGAFAGNTSLRYVEIPESVQSIGNGAFGDCINLVTVYLPKDVKTGEYVTQSSAYPGPFEDCLNLENVTFAEGTTTIAEGILYKSGIRRIEIPQTVTSIGYNAFGKCTNLEEVKWSEALTSIGDEAFAYCLGLKDVLLPDNVEVLGCGAFLGCTNLTTIYLPKNVEAGAYVAQSSAYPGPFQGCSNLENVTFAEGTTVISEGILYSSGIIKIELPKTVTEIEYKAFGNCQKLEEVQWSEALTTIGWQAFEDCSNLKEVLLPDSMRRLGCGAFRNCDLLEKLYVPADMVLDSYTGANSAYPPPFTGCLGLKIVEFSTGIEKIQPYLLYNTGIQSLSIPQSVEEIGEGAFAYCVYLSEIEFAESITVIGAKAFTCTSLVNVCIPDSVTNMGESVFSQCTSLKNIQLPSSRKNIMALMFANCTSLEEITLPSGVTTIQNQAFKNCTSLKTINWSKELTQIQQYAFENCDMLEKIEVPDTVTTLGSGTFYDCDALTSISLPDSVTSLGSSIFYDCDLLTEVKLGSGITSIPASAFEHCDVLESIVLPYRVTSIGAKAFKDCVAFKEITIPRATTTIDATAFSYPAQLTIYGIAGTYAETFATNNNITFVNKEVPATSVKLNKNELTLNKGASETLVMIVTPENFTDAVSWKSSDTTVATIADNGTVKAVNVGTATIKLIVGNVSTSCKVTVVQPVTSISLNKTSLSLEALETYQLTATVNPSNAANKAVKWSSSDESVATVSENGLVTALKKGTTTITVATQDGSNITKSCTVTVTNTAIIASTPEELESAHNYANNFSDFWIYTKEGVSYLDVTFDSKTNIEDGFDYLYIYDSQGNEVGKYTGTELAGKTIRVTGDTLKIQLISDDSGSEWGFKVVEVKTDKDIEEPDVPIENPFTDVPANEYYTEPVLWAVENNITSGLTATTFAPEASCTRGQVVTFLWRAHGCPEPKSTSHNFTDLKENEYYYKAVLWAVENGITSGMTKTTFAPDETVTRGQFVTFLHRAEGKPAYTVSNPFTDLKTGEYYYDAVLWAVENKVTSGLKPTLFGPEEPCTRGQVVTFLYRAYNK